MTAIQVDNISKLYHLGERLPNSLRDTIARILKFRRSAEDANELWALKDVSFEVSAGDTLGIIGRNGAGKSTLLKILSRITKPTSGSARLNGRVGSLLEVGTGFHTELTGRENIYMNGSILGMKHAEIDKKFDEIVAFSEVERFLDTPMKHYSSGMYMRLAFSVAAHLEPEILIVDEVLAVGDMEFQKKCLGKMDDVSKAGRTVLFVSHQMGMIAQLCKSCILLESGRLAMQGNTGQVINAYLNRKSDKGNSYHFAEDRVVGKTAFIVFQKLVNEQGVEVAEITNDDPIVLETKIRVDKFNDGLELSLSLQSRMKGRIFTINTPLKDVMGRDEKEKVIRIEVPANFIAPGQYSWISAINVPGSQLLDVLRDECEFYIRDLGSKFARYDGADYGCILMDQYKIEAFDDPG